MLVFTDSVTYMTVTA